MSFFIIPLVLTLIALLGVVVIVWRKMGFLRKLTPESHEVGDTWLHDMAPEAVDWYRGAPWRHAWRVFLLEFEKLLRRVRLAFSAMDRVSEQLVRKVRTGHIRATKQVQEHLEQQEQLQATKQMEEEQYLDEIDLDDPEQLKQEEQRLIVAIAQAPKQASLYSDLARVYIKMRTYADAVEALAAAVKLAPENESYQRRLDATRKRLALTP